MSTVKYSRTWFLPWLAAALGIAAALMPACTDYDESEQVLTLGDMESYGRLVQPYVGLRCGSLDCHGDSGRPLRIYAEDGLRLRADLREADITEEEIRRNVEAFAGVSPEAATPDEHLALLKGLAVSAGGYAHLGGDVWASTGDPGYRCIRLWLEGRADETEAEAACVGAYEEVAGDRAP